MAARRKITQAERRHQDQLRRNGLRVAAVYETRLAKSRRAELRRVLDLAMDYKPEAIEDVIIENLDESGYLPGWWVGLWTQAGMPMAKETARALREAKAAEEDDIWQMTLRSYATRRAGNEIVSVTGTWRDSLVKITREVLEADLGLGVEKITKRIYEQYRDRLEKWQIRRIAQTEAMIGMADAAALSATTLDVRFTKEWCISGLGNTRESHEAMDGVVVDMDEPFKLPGGLMMYPHDTSMDADAGEIINCACACIRRPKRGATTQERRPEPAHPETGQEEAVELSQDRQQQEREQRIEAIMKELPDGWTDEAKRAMAENDLELERVLGITKGTPMSVAGADEQAANPLLGTGKAYTVNCVTCSHAYALRRRGFEVSAKGNFKGSRVERASFEDMHKFWRNTDGTAVAAAAGDTRGWQAARGYKTMTPGRWKEFVLEQCKEAGDYEFTFTWKGRSSRHTTILHRDAAGKISWVEPQRYNGKAAERDLMSLLNGLSNKPYRGDCIIRVDDKLFNTSWADLFDVK